MSLKERFKSTSFTNRIVWIVLVFGFWYFFFSSIPEGIMMSIMHNASGLSNSMRFVLEYYAPTIWSVVVLFFVCLLPKNREMGKSFLPRDAGKALKALAIGLALGFVMNFSCILCAILHGDIKLYYDFSLSGLPVMIAGFIFVFIQSSSEELWTRGFLYERINVHYPLWVAIIVNGIIFGLLHSFNPGLTALAMADLIICGIAFSLLRWYSGSIWTAFGVHTMWNYTQNLIFGLPNSGLVSETSIFHMDALNATSNLIYDYEFGVEGAVPAVLMDLALGLVCLYLGWKAGRIGELFDTKEKLAAPPEVEILTE